MKRVRIYHPENDLYATVTQKSFDDVWSTKGFILAEDISEEAMHAEDEEE